MSFLIALIATANTKICTFAISIAKNHFRLHHPPRC
ncbi:hypothetical protein B6N60_01438 [Richelia sinica FACHB-800]|uniref:Uncharacterized protein n=1 Tax=Richelia sinica FACHB-800 TaxID=1357546 RepID=A0A975Y438_9NOST|nr:hypothetical protein B6N60_01438 [Richelia sinica FACHB-800]